MRLDSLTFGALAGACANAAKPEYALTILSVGLGITLLGIFLVFISQFLTFRTYIIVEIAYDAVQAAAYAVIEATWDENFKDGDGGPDIPSWAVLLSIGTSIVDGFILKGAGFLFEDASEYEERDNARL